MAVNNDLILLFFRGWQRADIVAIENQAITESGVTPGSFLLRGKL
jgi:hypothetical protein